MPAKPSILRELGEYLVGFAARCRAMRNHSAHFEVTVVQDIAADLRRENQQLAAAAYTAEQADLEAAKLLEEAVRDGFSNADLPAVRTAIRHIRRSARIDRRLSEARG